MLIPYFVRSVPNIPTCQGRTHWATAGKGSDSIRPSPRARPQSFDVQPYHQNGTDYGDGNPLLTGSCDFDTVIY